MDLKKMTKEQQAARDAARKPVAKATDVVPDAPPAVRKGEDSMSSRPFRLLNMMGYLSRKVSPDKAKLEIDLMQRFRKAMDDTRSTIDQAADTSFLFPLGRELLPDVVAYHDVTKELLQASAAGTRGYDPDEAAWLRKAYEPGYQKTAMSYLTDTTGGNLVAPPDMGEIIPLMRNKSALDRAGVKNYPLPPQGKVVFPRMTGASSVYWVGENTSITESNPTTGEVSMMAKKLAVLVRVPNELFKYTSGAAESIIREDMAKSLALKLDAAGFYGAGGGGEPKGLVRYDDSNELIDYAAGTPAPRGVATNGNVVMPEDGYRMAALVEDRNFDVDGDGFKWVMRPRLWGTISSTRADSVTAGDGAGPFAQAITRLVGDKVGREWCGYKVIGSAQIRSDQTKGSGTNLTEVWGGVWANLMLGMYGAVEFAANDRGEDTFIKDQTMIRGILFADCCPRYPGSFIYFKECLRS